MMQSKFKEEHKKTDKAAQRKKEETLVNIINIWTSVSLPNVLLSWRGFADIITQDYLKGRLEGMTSCFKE